MKTRTGRSCIVLCLVVISTGCISPRVQIPPTRTTYTVSATGSGIMTGVETIKIIGDWVVLDGRKLIPTEKIEYIRADRELPSQRK